MKRILCILVFLPALVHAQTVSGSQLEIGPTGSNQVTDSPMRRSGAIGSSNQVLYDNSLAIGYANVINSYGGAVGVGSNNGIRGFSSMAVGFQNFVTADQSISVGIANTVFGSGENWQGAVGATALGGWNSVGGRFSFASGTNNFVSGSMGEEFPYWVDSTAVLGTGLISVWSSSLIAGCYNDSAIPPDAGLLFAVGNGSNSDHRSNAFEVYKSGKIQMPRQGDILMGEFGNPEP